MPALAEIDSILQELNVKTAAAKRAEEEGAGSGSAAKDPGSKGGPSTHPTAKTDGNNHPAPAGFFAREHTENIKKDVPNNVETASENRQDSSYDHVQIGLKASPTGEDPSTENDYRTGGKDDPGTSSKIDAEDIGEKYSSYDFPTIYKLACDLSNDFLARVANNDYFGKSAHNVTPSQAAQVGAALAEAAGVDAEQYHFAKQAAAREVLAAVLQEGYEDADMVGELLYKSASYQDALAKHANPLGGAMEGGAPGMDAGLPGDPSAGGIPPEMMAAAGGGEGGMPPEMAAGPGEEGGAGGEGGDGQIDEEAINEITNALIEAGISPEQLMAAAQEAMAGAPEAEPAAMLGGDKTANARPVLTKQECGVVAHLAKLASDHLFGGRFRKVRPNTSKKAHDRKEFSDYLGYVREVLKV